MAENTPNASKNFSPICLPKAKSFKFLKKSSLWVSVVRGSNVYDQEKISRNKAFCFKKLYRPFTVWIFISDFKNFANSQPSPWNFKSSSRSQEQYFLPVGQNNFGNKYQFLWFLFWIKDFFHKNLVRFCRNMIFKMAYHISSYSFLPWIVSSPWIISSLDEFKKE